MAKAEAKAEAPPARNGNGHQQPEESNLERFSRELHQRWPNRLIKRFVLPKSVRDAREVFIIELTSRDEVQAAIFAEQQMSQIEKNSFRLAADAERRELLRLSIVGIGEQRGEDMTYRHANHDGIPLVGIDKWTPGAWTALSAYHGSVNGVPTSELQSGIEAAQTVGAFALPQQNNQQNEAPQPVSTGK